MPRKVDILSAEKEHLKKPFKTTKKERADDVGMAGSRPSPSGFRTQWEVGEVFFAETMKKT